MGQPADYVRQAGFDAIQQEQMVLQYAQSHGKITRKTQLPFAALANIGRKARAAGVRELAALSRRI
jgi:ATP-dependent DNA helicase RecG